MDVTRINTPTFQGAPASVEVATPTVQTRPVQETSLERTSRDAPNSTDARFSESLSRAVTAINATFAAYSRHLSISLHQETGRHMVTVYNSETNEPIREIPPESVLDAHASVMELAGLFIDTRG